MTAPTEDDPACPPLSALAQGGLPSPESRPPLQLRRRAFDSISARTWDRLAAKSRWATPFASWSFHRAWWDAYGGGAHDQTLVAVDPDSVDPSEIVGIIPLMHRHAVEPADSIRHTAMRRHDDEELTPVAPSAKVIYFGASYHADYATVLASPDDLDAIAGAFAETLAGWPAPEDDHADPWDAVDLRRLRCGDPAATALERAFRVHGERAGWRVRVEREDVCPVTALDPRADFDGFLSTLDRKARHEIRRKMRRAEAAGPVRLEFSLAPVDDLEEFIDLHQKRWGGDGLFPPTQGGASSRTFFRRLFELCGADGTLELGFLTVGGARVAAGVWFDGQDTLYYYNAGVEPAARDLSPGVNLVAATVGEALARGRRRVDFLRGDEAYKYEWGAVDEPIQRVLVTRI